MNISHTVYPDRPLSFNEWSKKYRVSSQVAKFDGMLKAEHMMRDWNTSVIASKPSPSFLHSLKELILKK